jgi:hypothetical protein
VAYFLLAMQETRVRFPVRTFSFFFFDFFDKKKKNKREKKKKKEMAGRDYDEYEEMSALEAIPAEGLPYYPPRFTERRGDEDDQDGQQHFNRSLRDDTLFADASFRRGDNSIFRSMYSANSHIDEDDGEEGDYLTGGMGGRPDGDYDQADSKDDFGASRYHDDEGYSTLGPNHTSHLPPSQQYMRTHPPSSSSSTQQHQHHQQQQSRRTGGGGGGGRNRTTSGTGRGGGGGGGGVGSGIEMMAGPLPQSRDLRWITVFGFPRSRTIEILHTFRQYGEFLHTQQSTTGNWIHICYSTKLQAEKALSKNGKIINGVDGDLMIGVVSCSEENDWLRPPLPSSSLRPVLPPSNPFAQPSPHDRPALSSQLLPQSSSSSFWSSFFTYVLGL